MINSQDLLNCSMKTNASSTIALPALSEKQAAYFVKLSQLYNSIISIVPLDDQSNIPKSNIELFQRFQQILKELELSYEVSPYGRFFKRLDEHNWKIKDEVNDSLWRFLSLNIEKVYDKDKGQVLQLKRRSTNPSARDSPTLAPRRKSCTVVSPDFSLTQVDNKLEQVMRQQDFYPSTEASTGQFDWPRAVADDGIEQSIIDAAQSSNAMLSQSNSNTNMNLSLKSQAMDDETATSTEDQLATKRRKRNYGAVGSEEQEVVNELLQLKQNKDRQPNQNIQQSSLSDLNIMVYERLLKEKDARIQTLQNDLDAQSKEILWLKKLIMEDMNYLRTKGSNGRDQPSL